MSELWTFILTAGCGGVVMVIGVILGFVLGSRTSIELVEKNKKLIDYATHKPGCYLGKEVSIIVFADLMNYSKERANVVYKLH